MTTRRELLLGIGAALGLVACGQKLPPELTLLERAKALIANRPSLDLHAHPGVTFVRGVKNLAPALQAFIQAGASEERAVSDMSAGGMSAAVFCAVADVEILDLVNGGPTSNRDFEPGEAQASYRTQIGFLNKLVTDGLVEKIISPSDIQKIKHNGGIGAMLGVEGGDFLEGSAERVAEAYADGVRCIGPLHYHAANDLGDIMTAAPVHNGLTNAGAVVIRAMNDSGVIIDVAHASEKTAFGILETTNRPVICSHTHINTPSFIHPRFISLDLAKEIAAAGGVIGAWPAGIGISDLDGFTDRTFELIEAVGVDHVGIGTDMDSNFQPVWDNYRQFPDVVAKMLERGLTDEETAKVIGGNGLRVFETVSQ
jgi:membrane dipeptidase